MDRYIRSCVMYVTVAILVGLCSNHTPLLASEVQTESLEDTEQRNPFSALLSGVDTRAQAVVEPVDAESSPELFLETVNLRFLDARSLKSVLDRMVTPYGTVAVNGNGNSVVLCDTQESVARLVAEIAKVDRMPEQIMVEVVILDVQLTDDQEIGINWDLISDDLYDFTYRQNFSNSRLRSTIERTDTIGDASAFNTVGLGGDLSIISGTIRHVLHAIQQRKNVDIVASPRALVVSGQSATIKAVEEIPYSEVSDTAAGGAAAITSTEFKEVGVNLQINATVTDGNSIFLNVETEQNVRTGESDAGVPVVDTRRATTSLVLEDGQIVVIGGLRREEKTKEVDQVPLLGDLPLVGVFFRSTVTVTHHSELVVLLSPHIHRGSLPSEDIMRRYDAIHEKSLLSPEMTDAGDQ